MAPVDLRAVIAAGDRRSARSAASATTIEGSFATIEGDDVLLRQAFSNLLRNSLEACADAGMRAAHLRAR